MKKFLSLTLTLAMLGTALTGCGSKDAASPTSAENTQQTAPARQEQSQTEKALALINTFATPPAACSLMATSSTIWHTAPVRMLLSVPWNILHPLM